MLNNSETDFRIVFPSCPGFLFTIRARHVLKNEIRIEDREKKFKLI